MFFTRAIGIYPVLALRIIIILALLIHCGCSSKLAKAVFSSRVPSGTVVVENDPKLEKALISELERQRKNNRKLDAVDAPKKIAKLERKLLMQRLRADGYYRASITIQPPESQPVYKIVQGPRYTIERIDLKIPQNISSISPELLNLQKGNALIASDILAAQKKIETVLKEKECLFSIKVDYDVIVIHPRESARVTFKISPSPQAHFGVVSFSGLETIHEDYLRARQSIKEGDCFKRGKLDQARLSLLRTNLILSAVTELGEQLQDPGDNEASANRSDILTPLIVPLNFLIRERDHRTFSAGLLYDSDEGPGISLGWEHRNLLGRAQKLDLDANFSDRDKSIQGRLTIPHYRREEQSLALTTDFRQQQTDAFDSKEGSFGAEISRQLRSNIRGFIGLNLDFYRVLENQEEDFALVSLPMSFEYDRRNDALNPTRGWVAGGRLRPYWDALGANTSFVKNTFATSAYHTLENMKYTPTIAVRTAFGSIEGASADEIPANVRFFVGGGGSVRGYPYQSIGPLDEESDPIGGLSFNEISAELRGRFSESWGAVLFVDGGSAFASQLPNYGTDLLWSAGAGVRFFTSFAPIRFDVAIPLDKRDAIDDSFQIYVSIGQSF